MSNFKVRFKNDHHLLIDLKQTNFIERLVEDALLGDADTGNQALATFTAVREEDTHSQFSHLNESIEASQTTT